MMNCSILFALQPFTISSEEVEVAFTINHLIGRDRLWETSERCIPTSESFHSFAVELCKVRTMVAMGTGVAQGLMSLPHCTHCTLLWHCHQPVCVCCVCVSVSFPFVLY